jgi:hypothetical protein
MISNSTPAIALASSNPPMPKREAIGARITTNAAVGPDTWTREPPSRAMIRPPTMAV